MKKTLLAVLISLASFTSFAQEKTFPVGDPVEVQALFCLAKEDAQTIADNKGELNDAIGLLVVTGRCRPLHGVAVYIRKVYEKDGWAVWELRSGNIPTFYEATDWKPKKKGIDCQNTA